MTSRRTSPPKTAPNAPPAPPVRVRTDWPAVERDYRTDKFTLRELAAKHKTHHTTIARHAERHQWAKDLSEAIRQATRVKLIQDSVQQTLHQESAGAHQSATETVLAAAELNKNVILGHRTDLKSTRNVASDLLQELAQAALLATHQELLTEIMAGEGATPADLAHARAAVSRALSVNTRITSVKSLADTFAKLQEAERKAFNIDSAAPPGEADAMSEFLNDLSARGSRLPTGANQ